MTKQIAPQQDEKRRIDDLWIQCLHLINEGRMQEANAIAISACYNSTTLATNYWEMHALTIYMMAKLKEICELQEATKLMDKICDLPLSISKGDVAPTIILAEAAIMHSHLSLQRFGEKSVSHLKKAQNLIEQISSEKYGILPRIQSLQIARVLAMIMVREEEYEKSLDLLESTKAAWEEISEGEMTFHHEIPLLSSMMEAVKMRVDTQKSAKEYDCKLESLKLQIDRLNDKVAIMQNKKVSKAVATQTEEYVIKEMTIKLDAIRYIDNIKGSTKYTYGELWNRIANNKKCENVEVVVSKKEENKISASMVKKLGITKENFDKDMKIPLIISKGCNYEGDFLIVEDMADEIIINEAAINA